MSRLELLRMGLRTPLLPEFEEFSERPRWNVAPTQRMPILRLDVGGSRELAAANWGFVPSWTREDPKLKPINARAENVATSGMFRRAFQSRRCLVPADGFYEWQGAKAPKQPYFIRMRDNGVFCFAGLWDRWKREGAEPIDTFTIITTRPNALMETIHSRMPVIIAPDQYAQWLEGSEPKSLLEPYPAAEMEAFKVSTSVNSPRNDRPDCCAPQAQEKTLLDDLRG